MFHIVHFCCALHIYSAGPRSIVHLLPMSQVIARVFLPLAAALMTTTSTIHIYIVYMFLCSLKIIYGYGALLSRYYVIISSLYRKVYNMQCIYMPIQTNIIYVCTLNNIFYFKFLFRIYNLLIHLMKIMSAKDSFKLS